MENMVKSDRKYSSIFCYMGLCHSDLIIIGNIDVIVV